MPPTEAETQLPPKRELSWDHVYLLGWFNEQGHPFLTTWDGNLPMVHVVVTGVKPLTMPLWSAPVPPNAHLHEIPADKAPQEYAQEMGGYHAFGWYLEEPFERKQ